MNVQRLIEEIEQLMNLNDELEREINFLIDAISYNFRLLRIVSNGSIENIYFIPL